MEQNETVLDNVAYISTPYLTYSPKSIIILNRVKCLAAYWGLEDLVYAMRLVYYSDKYADSVSPILKLNLEQLRDYGSLYQLETDLWEVYGINLMDGEVLDVEHKNGIMNNELVDFDAMDSIYAQGTPVPNWNNTF